ncbi:MAG: LacI family DNA-binding transcriptional regulator [Candidatus Limnocylindrales bacterium]
MAGRRSARPKAHEAHSLRDVADLAGVSVATASRVMSGSSHPVSHATRAKVQSAADQLAFEPNRLARALVTSRSHTVGVIVHDIADPYFGEIVKGLEEELAPHDYWMFVTSSERDPAKELGYVRALQAHQVDAIVFAASSLTDPEYTRQLTALAIPFTSRGGVMVALSDQVLDVPRVRFDNRTAIRQMVMYLADLGHRDIGYIGGPSDLEVSRIRLEAFHAVIDELGIPAHVVEGGFTATGGERAMRQLLEQAAITGVVVASDLMAIGATRAILAAGLRVPEDVSVAGFGDIPLAAYGPVPLTTMRVPTYEMGRAGARLVLAALDGKRPADIVLSGHIVERDSVLAVSTARRPRNDSNA